MSRSVCRRIVLEKTSAVFGREPVGRRFASTFEPGLPEDEARIRAFRMLKRTFPDENPMCWQQLETEHVPAT